MTRLCALHVLSYWRSLSLHHCLDPMHIFKNVCKFLISHLVGEKDNVAARRGLEFSNTEQQLWSIVDRGICAIRTNSASYILPQEHRKIFIGRIKNIITFTSFGANPNNTFIKPDRVSRLKSHNFYIILRFYYPIEVRGLMTVSVREAICKLSRMVQWIFTKNINTNEIEIMKDESHVVMTLLLMQFPTSISDGQQHLMIHLVDEGRIADRMPCRWMFFIKRFCTAKNKAGGKPWECIIIYTIGHLDKYAPPMNGLSSMIKE